MTGSLKSKIYLIIFVAVILKLIIAFLTFHVDLTALNLAGSLISSGQVFTFYDYLFQLPENHILRQAFSLAVFTYPPIAYLYFGLIETIFVNILQLRFIPEFVVVTPDSFGNILFNISNLVLKSHFLIWDILTAIVLAKIIPDKKQKLQIMVLWLFNPVNLFATYMMGQFDIIPAFFIVASIFFLNKKRLILASFMLGFGIAFKLFPIFLLIPLVIFGKSWRQRILMIVAGLIPYVVSVIPYLFSPGYKTSALLANQSLKSLYAQIPVSGGQSILLFPVFILLFYLIFFHFREKFNNLWQNYFVILIFFFVFTHTHPQWFLWIIPLLIIDLVQSKFANWLPFVLFHISFLGLLFLFDPSLSTRLFAPAFNNLYSAPNIWQIFGMEIEINLYRSIFHTLFVGSALFYIYTYFKNSNRSHLIGKE